MEPHQQINGERLYQCVRCQSDLQGGAGQVFTCQTCGALYPEIGGVRILADAHVDLLHSHFERVVASRKEVEDKRLDRLARFRGGAHSREALASIERAYKGQLSNLELIEESLSPVKEYLSAATAGRSFLGNFFNPGWAAVELLGYFYRDWYGTDEALFVGTLFSDAIKKHCRVGDGAVAVLGCGAGGLLPNVSGFFPAVFGVDLSISALLLTERLLGGGGFDIHFSLPKDEYPLEQKRVELRGPAFRPAGLKLLMADVNRLPFQSSSLSCVVTQFLMDLMRDHRAFAAEIRRVLTPGGIWLNFGLPGYVALGDQLTHLDLHAFFNSAGFDLLDLSLHQYKHLDLTPVSEWAASSAQPAMAFAVRKNEAESSRPPDYFADYFARKGGAIWTKVPRLVAGVSVSRERLFTAAGVAENNAVIVHQAKRLEALGVTDGGAGFVGWFLRQVNGTNSVQGIADSMRMEFGESIGEDEIVMFFRLLSEEAIVTLS